MATAAPAAPPAAGPGSSKRAERRFFSTYMIVLAAAVFIGFAPSFFLRGLVEPFGPLRPLRPIVVVHGLITASWLLLFPIQARLIATNRWALHKRLGNFGFLMAAGMMTTAYLLAVHIYHEPAPPPLTPAMNVVLPLSDFLTLCVLVPLAWRWRMDGARHKRIMTVIACLLAGAAIFRLPFGDRTSLLGIFYVHLALFATVLPLWAWDLRALGRLHRATAFASAIVFVDMFGRLLIAQSAAWSGFVALLPGFGSP
jgi:hypothetical protein